MIACDPLARTIRPSHTHPLEDWQNGGLISIWPMCIQPVSNSHAVWHTHRLPSPVIGHRSSCTTPEPLGPFMPRPAPIQACHPEPIDGWLTSLWSQPCHPCPCVCMWRVVHHCPTESPASTVTSVTTSPDQWRCPRPPVQRSCDLPIPMSDPDTGLPPVRAIIRIGVPSAILDQVRLREMLGYIVIPGAVWIFSLISEDNCCTR